MDRGAEQTGVESTAQASRVVLLLTDGEDHIEQLDEAIEIARKSAVKLYVFGIGTDKGGPVPVRDENGQARGYKRDRSGAAIVSSLNTKALTGLAAAVGGKYWNVTADEYEIDELLQELGALNRAEGIAKRVVVYKERFQIPLAISVFLFLLELCLAARKRRSVKYGAALVLVAVTGLFSTKVYAAPLETYLANEKGIKALSEGKVDEARKQFGDAQARNPDLPELLFNQGVVQLQGGDAESAVQAFAGAAKAAEQKNQPGLVGRSLYNLGGVQAQKGDVPGAVRSYAAAIERAKLAHDTKLEADARKNLELLVQQQQQQQKQKQDQKQDQKQEKDQKQDQKQQQQEQKQDQQQKQDQKYSETPRRKQQFNSPKLSKEDADRVMAELSNRERELQAKLKKQKGKATAVQKDW
jgi:Ca-activated chloride channel family protein